MAEARTDMMQLALAIASYKHDYGHLPAVGSNLTCDVTFGIGTGDIRGFHKIDGTSLVSVNSDLMVVLMDIDAGINAKHAMNPLRHWYFEPKSVNDTKSHGISLVDQEFRDPYGNPYVISMDANGDGKVRDAVYAEAVAFPTNAVGSATNAIFEIQGSVMIWSRGHDGKVGMDASDRDGVNKDNVVDWQ
jgi:hypothetical protein